jgi:hypothetical protein
MTVNLSTFTDFFINIINLWDNILQNIPSDSFSTVRHVNFTKFLHDVSNKEVTHTTNVLNIFKERILKSVFFLKC